MQLMPGTALALNVTDRFDIEQNLRGGIAYIAHLLVVYRGELPLALAAYNAGPGAVDACGCVPDNGATVQYVSRVRALYEAALSAARRPLGQPVGAGGAGAWIGLVTTLRMSRLRVAAARRRRRRHKHPIYSGTTPNCSKTSATPSSQGSSGSGRAGCNIG